MFICQVSNHLSKPRERRVRIVVKTRERQYPPDGVTNKLDYSTFGTEVVREINACVSCATAVQNKLTDLPSLKG